MTITNQRLREEYEGSDGPAKVTATYVFDTTTNTYKIVLGGEITVSEHGVQNSDLVAAQTAFSELVTHIRDKYPYVAP